MVFPVNNFLQSIHLYYIENKNNEENDELESFKPPSNYQNLIHSQHGNQPEEFKKRSLEIVNKTISLIQENFQMQGTKDHFLKPILNFLGIERHQLAHDLNSKDAAIFGIWTNSFDGSTRCYTPLNDSYEYYRKKCQNSILDHIISQSPESKNFIVKETEQFQKRICACTDDKMKKIFIEKNLRANFSDDQTIFHAFGDACKDLIESDFKIKDKKILEHIFVFNFIKINNKWFPLSTLLMSKIENESDFPVGILHGSSVEVKDVIEHLSPLFNRIILWNKTDDSKKDLIEAIAELHFYLCQLNPFCRGTAAIMEYLSKALMKFHGFPLRPYKDPIRPDLESQILFPNEFIKQYSDMFE